MCVTCTVTTKTLLFLSSFETEGNFFLMSLFEIKNINTEKHKQIFAYHVTFTDKNKVMNNLIIFYYISFVISK